MSTKMFCDNCGKEEIKKGEIANITIYDYSESNTKINKKDHFFDLCKNCKKDFQKIIIDYKKTFRNKKAGIK